MRKPFQLFKEIFKGARHERLHNPRLPSVPRRHRIYAVGDIHGRADLLEKLHQAILEDAFRSTQRGNNTIIYLGDYIDRGLDSKNVIELLIAHEMPRFDKIFLKGNHEEALLQFLANPDTGYAWFQIGGDATVYSYCVGTRKMALGHEDFSSLRDQLYSCIPEEHLSFFKTLKLMHRVGDYLFVHAGIRPGIPLQNQSPEDLLWIRDEFIKSQAEHGVVVVHGHSFAAQPEVQTNRIGIDTGAYATNLLTCLVLEGTARYFIST